MADLIHYIQNEELDIETRVQEALKGEMKTTGIANGILTGLLHTLFPIKYGVWNNETKKTLEIIRRKPIDISMHSKQSGILYGKINQTLIDLANELNTDLTTIDGLMYYIGENIRFI